jgi:hypothetical protein
LRGPGDHLALNLDGGMVAAAAIHRKNPGEQFRQIAGRIAAAVHPTHHGGMLVGAAVRQDEPGKILVQGGQGGATRRQRRTQFGTQIGRHVPPHRPRTHARHPVDHVIQHAVAERANLRPILRIQAHAAGLARLSANSSPNTPATVSPASSLNSLTTASV